MKKKRQRVVERACNKYITPKQKPNKNPYYPPIPIIPNTMSLTAYYTLKRTLFAEAIMFLTTEYTLTPKGQEEELVKELWSKFKKYETKNSLNKVPKKKTEVPEEERCAHPKADGSACSMKKASAAVMKEHPEYNKEFCATHNRKDLTPKKASTSTNTKKYVCGHKQKNGTLCTKKVAKEGDKCGVYMNMQKVKAKEEADESTPKKTVTKTPVKVAKAAPVEEDDDADTEEIEVNNAEDSEDEALPSPAKTPKAKGKKRVVEESDDEAL